MFQIDRGKTGSAARILSPKQTRRPLPCLLIKSFFYGNSAKTYTVQSVHTVFVYCSLIYVFSKIPRRFPVRRQEKFPEYFMSCRITAHSCLLIHKHNLFEGFCEFAKIFSTMKVTPRCPGQRRDSFVSANEQSMCLSYKLIIEDKK